MTSVTLGWGGGQKPEKTRDIICEWPLSGGIFQEGRLKKRTNDTHPFEHEFPSEDWSEHGHPLAFDF